MSTADLAQGVPQGVASFPGVRSVLRCTYSRTLGISPGIAIIEIVPQAELFSEFGTLTISFDGQQFEFPDCKVDMASVERNGNGEIWRLTILDRRWLWRNFGAISGSYNVWRTNFTLRDGKPDPRLRPEDQDPTKLIDTSRTLAELAQLCLEAMGEEDFDTSALPNEQRNTVDWDYDVPAEALEAVCAAGGCRVALTLDNRIRIVKVGEGADLPGDYVLEKSLTVDPPEMPEFLAVVCGPNLYQADFVLKAIGKDIAIDTDGLIRNVLKPINDLSYKPQDGWDYADIPNFFVVDPGLRSLRRRLAVESVFRYYRAVMPVKVPGYGVEDVGLSGTEEEDEPEDTGDENGQITKLEQVLPLIPRLVDNRIEEFDYAPIPPMVSGIFYNWTSGYKNTATKLEWQQDQPYIAEDADDPNLDTQFYLRPFTVDTTRGLVIFETYTFRNKTNDDEEIDPENMQLAPARLILRTCFHVRHPETLALRRYTKVRSTGATNGKTRYLHHDEITLTVWGKYDDASYDTTNETGIPANDERSFEFVTTNRSEVDKECDHWLDSAMLEYNTDVSHTARYCGLRGDIDLDGAVQHIVYIIGGSDGASTVASRNSENLLYTISYNDRRRIERGREAVRQSWKLERQKRKENMEKAYRQSVNAKYDSAAIEYRKTH